MNKPLYGEKGKSDVYDNVSECILRFSNGRKKIISRIDINTQFTVNVITRRVESAGFVELVLQHHMSTATAKELATRCGYKSTRTFQRHFYKHFHTTPKQWLMSVKKREMIYLLKNTNFTLGVIAERLGFVDDSHLHNFCTRSTGMTPAQLREKMKSLK